MANMPNSGRMPTRSSAPGMRASKPALEALVASRQQVRANPNHVPGQQVPDPEAALDVYIASLNRRGGGAQGASLSRQGREHEQQNTGHMATQTSPVGQNFQPGLGRQLSSRVDSGAITEGQAEKTAAQRRVLEEAYGPEWRDQVYGENVEGLRAGLATNHENDPQYQAAYKAMLERRKSMLAQARTKLNGGTTAPAA